MKLNLFALQLHLANGFESNFRNCIQMKRQKNHEKHIKMNKNFWRLAVYDVSTFFEYIFCYFYAISLEIFWLWFIFEWTDEKRCRKKNTKCVVVFRCRILILCIAPICVFFLLLLHRFIVDLVWCHFSAHTAQPRHNRRSSFDRSISMRWLFVGKIIKIKTRTSGTHRYALKWANQTGERENTTECIFNILWIVIITRCLWWKCNEKIKRMRGIIVIIGISSNKPKNACSNVFNVNDCRVQ